MEAVHDDAEEPGPRNGHVLQLGAEDVQGGTGTKGIKVVATFEQTLELKHGTAKKRRQKLYFEYDGEDWRQPAAVVVDGQLALNHHIGLPAVEKDKDADAINKEVLARAFVPSVAVDSVADFLEKGYTDEDAR
ncbi:hypothetical protein ACFU6R_14990 [Streptomyces sp. NPDC057499]|uniref:hypothetical protein n=1 Tax=Streptomyces sp. NPDC057499 TaxID=3346150 RepID=UPI0036D1865E